MQFQNDDIMIAGVDSAEDIISRVSDSAGEQIVRIVDPAVRSVQTAAQTMRDQARQALQEATGQATGAVSPQRQTVTKYTPPKGSPVLWLVLAGGVAWLLFSPQGKKLLGRR